jgi:hypothetical protein
MHQTAIYVMFILLRLILINFLQPQTLLFMKKKKIYITVWFCKNI